MEDPLPLTEKPFTINVITGQGGGGHYAMYNALKAIALEQNLPWEFQVTDMDDIVDSLAEQKQVVNAYNMMGFSGHDLYNMMMKSGWTWLWPLKMRLNKLLVKLNHDAGVKFFEQYWREQQPDLVVSVMPLYNKGLWQSLQQALPNTPYVTVMVDMADYPPAFWHEPEIQSYVMCPTEKAVEQAHAIGVKQKCIVKTSGISIHPNFYKQVKCDRAAERKLLGLDPDCLTGLVLFGGYGSKVMLDIAQQLEHFQQKLQLIFICGRNEELAAQLHQSRGEQRRFVTGFTKDIPYFMHLSDFFIGKPGPACLSEATVMNLPVIVERNISTLIHELYNTVWVEQNEVGIVIPNFSQIGKAVEQFLQPETFARYQANVADINNRAIFEISDFIQNLFATHSLTEGALASDQ
ncbi:MGDG synthase family glycosyltransferase [Aliterella atlantica]|uniref:MGDG synthase family glycosyltransferase n=1 Tax=Aliterella atlantica TaxID=1827278 RepID=UPI0005D2F2ED|nr:glycosyltransferase [Aliterella atlantica]